MPGRLLGVGDAAGNDVPFRWDLVTPDQLGSMLGGATAPDLWFLDELVACTSKVLARSGDGDLVFDGPKRDERTVQALAEAAALVAHGRSRAGRQALARAIGGEPALAESWLRSLVTRLVSWRLWSPKVRGCTTVSHRRSSGSCAWTMTSGTQSVRRTVTWTRRTDRHSTRTESPTTCDTGPAGRWGSCSGLSVSSIDSGGVTGWGRVTGSGNPHRSARHSSPVRRMLRSRRPA